MPEKINELYSLLSKDDYYKDKVGSEAEFVEKFSTPEKLSSLHGLLSKDDYYKDKVGDVKTFTEKFGSKKKVSSQPPIPVTGQRFALGGESTPQLPLTSQSKLAKKPIVKPKDYGLRNDGSRKGRGFFGELPNKNGGVSTELSIKIDLGKGEQEIPTLVPTLTPQEKDWLLAGNNPNDKSKEGEAIVRKAIEWHDKRKRKGKSPYAGNETYLDYEKRFNKNAVKEYNPFTATMDEIRKKIDEERVGKITKSMLDKDTRYNYLKTKQEAYDIGYTDDKSLTGKTAEQKYWDDRQTYLVDKYLDQNDKEEVQALAKFKDLRRLGKEKEANAELEKYLNAKSAYRKNIDDQIVKIKATLPNITDPTERTLAERDIQELEILKKPVYNPEQALVDFNKENASEIADVAKPSESPKEKLRKYTNALYTSVLRRREELGLTDDMNGMQRFLAERGILGSVEGAAFTQKKQELDDLHADELKLRNAVKIYELNRTPYEKDTALGVFAKSFQNELTPYKAGKNGVDNVIAGNIQSIINDAGIVDAATKEQLALAKQYDKKYEFLSPKWAAQTIAPTAAIMYEMALVAVVTKRLANVSGLGRLNNALELLAEEGKLTQAGKAYFNSIQNSKIGMGLLKAAASGVNYGIESQALTILAPQIKDEMGFANGLFAGGVGSALGSLTGKALEGSIKGIARMFGNEAPDAIRAIESYGTMLAKAKDFSNKVVGDTAEEYMEQLTSIYKQSDNYHNFINELRKHYETTDAVEEFATIFLMSLGAPAGSTLGRGLLQTSTKLYNNLNKEERKVADQIADELHTEERTAQAEAINNVVPPKDQVTEEDLIIEPKPKTEEITKELIENALGDDEDKTRTEKDFKNEKESYRIIVGDEAFNDIVESGVVRTNADKKGGESLAEKLARRPTLFPSFSKGEASMSYAGENPNHYIIVTEDESIKPSTSGRHGKGTTMFPTDENGNHLKELSGEKIKVYKHLGNGKYELVYANGKLIQPKTNTEDDLSETPKETTEENIIKPTPTEDNGVGNAGVEPVSVEEKPKPQKVKVLGKELNSYSNYIPSKVEDVEPDALYSFTADSKEGIPSLLHDVAYANKREVNGIKSENWHASISGDELQKLYPKSEQPTKTNIQNEKTNEVREVEKGRGEKGNEGGQQSRKENGQKTNDVQNEEVAEGGVTAPTAEPTETGTQGVTREGVPSEEIDAQRADIERRRQEEISKIVSKYFPNSKFTDILYHGTRGQERFEKFDENRMGELDSGYFGKGFYLTPERAYAEGYAKPYNGIVLYTVVNLENPLVTDANQANTGITLENNDGAIVKLGEDTLGISEEKYDPNQVIEVVLKKADQIQILSEEESRKVDEINAEYNAKLEALEGTTPTTEEKVSDALKDVESTAKALEGVDKEKLPKVKAPNEDVIALRNAKTKEQIDSALLQASQEQSVSKALDNLGFLVSGIKEKYFNNDYSWLKDLANEIEKISKGTTTYNSQAISEAYHNAKAKPEAQRSASDNELITSVETLLKPKEYATQEVKQPKGVRTEPEGGIKGGETKVTGVSDSVQRAKESEKEKVAEGGVKTPKSEISSKPKPENVKAIEEAMTKKSGTIKNEIIKEAADPTEVKKILDNLDSIKSKLAGLTTKDGDSVFSEECKWG